MTESSARSDKSARQETGLRVSTVVCRHKLFDEDRSGSSTRYGRFRLTAVAIYLIFMAIRHFSPFRVRFRHEL